MTDYASRLNQLEDTLKKQQMDVCMITEPANVFYYTGFLSEPHERFMAFVIDIKQQKKMLFVPSLDKEMAAEASDIETIIPVSDEEDPFVKFQENIGQDTKQIALEMKKVSMFQHQALLHVLPTASFTDIQPFINKQRMNKSRDELTHTKKAIEIVEKVMQEGIKKVKIGMTELELTAELEYLMKIYGAEGPSFSTIVLFGEKSALPHGTPGERKLQNGDFLLIDMGVHIAEGYCSDMTRTFIVGEATEKQKEIYNIVMQATEAGINAVRAGIPLKTFDIAARNIIDESGYGAYFNNRVGHGLGIEVHEEPSIHENNEQLAEKGSLFTIEPGIYLPGFGGVRIEDNVYINENGEAEVVTTLPTTLQILSGNA